MNPAAPQRNLHHTMAYRSEEEWWEDMIGKGPSDPDVVGHYPGQPTETHNYPLTGQTDIVLANELILGKQSF